MKRLIAALLFFFPVWAKGQDTLVLAKRLDPDAVVKIPVNDYRQIIKIRLTGGQKHYAVLTAVNDSFYIFRSRDDARIDTAAMNALARNRITTQNRDSIAYEYHKIIWHKEHRVPADSLSSIMIKDNWKAVPVGLRKGLGTGFFILAGAGLFLPQPFSFLTIASAGGVYLTGYLMANRKLDLKKKWYRKKIITNP